MSCFGPTSCRRWERPALGGCRLPEYPLCCDFQACHGVLFLLVREGAEAWRHSNEDCCRLERPCPALNCSLALERLRRRRLCQVGEPTQRAVAITHYQCWGLRLSPALRSNSGPTYIHTYVRTYIHTYIQKYIQHACLHACQPQAQPACNLQVHRVATTATRNTTYNQQMRCSCSRADNPPRRVTKLNLSQIAYTCGIRATLEGSVALSTPYSRRMRRPKFVLQLEKGDHVRGVCVDLSEHSWVY